jgi:Delta7-sterol 5-desaturase
MDAHQIFNLWTGIYLFDLFRYLIPTSLAFLIFWVIGKNNWRHLFIQKVFPRPKQIYKEFAYSMSTVVIFSIVGFGVYTAEKAGITQIYYKSGQYGILYMILSFIMALIFHDFYFYWTHRLMHHERIFKHVHRVHHESTNPSPWAAYSFHPWEALIQALVMPIMVFLYPLHPLVVFLFLTYMIVRNVIGHLGFEIFPKGFTKNNWLNWTTAVTHHNIHHERSNSNYGLYFSWWDRWMGTEDVKYHEDFDDVKSRPRACGLKSRKKKSAILSMLLISTTLVNAQGVEGKWTTFNEDTGSPLSVIEIVRIGNSIEGRVSRIYIEPFQGVDPKCTKCPGKFKDQKVIDMNIMWGFKKDDGLWSDGKVLDPESGTEYNSKLWLEDNNTLKVRGYGGMMDLFFRTQTWKRVGGSQTNNPVGIWNTIDDTWNKVKSQVEIVELNGELLGYIRKIYLLPHEGTDPLCIACAGELHYARIIGMRILYGFAWNGENWERGKILDPGNGNEYTSHIWLVNDNELKVRGFLGPFYRTQIWKRL